MAPKKPTITTTGSLFSEAPEVVEVEETEVEETTVVAPGAPATRKARIKGTWKMYWGGSTFDFEDGKTFVIPSDLYDYLKAHENIYDTI